MLIMLNLKLKGEMSLFKFGKIIIRESTGKFTVELLEEICSNHERLLDFCLLCKHLTNTTCSCEGNISFPFTSG